MDQTALSLALSSAVFDVPVLLQTVQDERITTWPGPPAVFQALLNYESLGDYDISTLRSCVTGAASIPVEMATGYASSPVAGVS